MLLLALETATEKGSLALVAGLSAEDFHRLYTKKHAVNRQRQEQGYSKDSKDEADNKGVV
jgi:hypothetical protein